MSEYNYIRLSDDSTFVPVGLNLCFPRFIDCDEDGLALYRRWIGKLATHGGNFIRLFLGHPFFDPEGDRCGDFLPDKCANLRAVLDMADAAGVKVKITLDHFRFIDPEPVAEMFPGAARFDRPSYHLSRGGVAESMEDYLGGEAGRKHFLAYERLRYHRRSPTTAAPARSQPEREESMMIGPLTGSPACKTAGEARRIRAR